MADKDRKLRNRLLLAVQRLPVEHLPRLEKWLENLHLGDATPAPDPPEPSLTGLSPAALKPDYWPHAPLHRLSEYGTFIVTAGTLDKMHHFRDPERRTLLESLLLRRLLRGGWQVEAWAVFSNHYHLVAHRHADARQLQEILNAVHAESAREINRLDRASRRQVWHNYWDTQLTYEKSYLARLNYVHQNAVKHRLVPVANQYHWCSARWFERTAKCAQVRTIYGFKTDRVRVEDGYDPV